MKEFCEIFTFVVKYENIQCKCKFYEYITKFTLINSSHTKSVKIFRRNSQHDEFHEVYIFEMISLIMLLYKLRFSLLYGEVEQFCGFKRSL